MDTRKFSGYVLVPAHPSGKDRIFINRLGFRARNAEDAEILAALYQNRALAAIEAKEFKLGQVNEYATRCTIVVEVRGVLMRSGWFLRANGVLELVTPFSGFARSSRFEK